MEEGSWRARHRRPTALRLRPSPLVLDLVVCAALIAIAVPATMDPSVGDSGTILDTVLMPAAVLPILLRRRAPFAAACALAAGCVISGIPTFDQIRVLVAVPAALLIVFSLASRAGTGRALAGLAVVLAGLTFVGATDSAIREDGGGVVGMIVFSFPLCGLFWAAGRVVRSRERVVERLRERSRQLIRQREQTAALAVEVERNRLASDLDIAASGPLRTMIGLAEGGERSLANGPEAEREVFAGIERLGRESLNEMRGLLGVLRSDDRGAHSPLPTLAQIDALLAGARAGGRVVDLEMGLGRGRGHARAPRLLRGLPAGHERPGGGRPGLLPRSTSRSVLGR